MNTVAEQSPDPTKRKFGELTFLGSYQLSSTDPRFGGLSGLDVLADDTLLAVSDAGRFVWIDLSRDGVTVAHASTPITELPADWPESYRRLVEQGNHEELIERRGFYYELYHSQFEEALGEAP